MLPTPAWAFHAYSAAQSRLPKARFGSATRTAPTLADVAGDFDVLMLDAYGVLNIGETAIPGVPERLKELRQAGKRLMVVSNSAAYPKRVALDRYRRMGFAFTEQEVTTSREALLRHLRALPPTTWGLMLPRHHGLAELEDLDLRFLGDEPEAYAEADGFVLLGSEGWSEAQQARLEAALRDNPRPLLVGNPDIVAPREGGLSLEPGHYAHRLADATGVVPRFFGKPFPAAFELALSRLSPCPAPERVLMVGDTLHTDILGGRSMGFATALVTRYGSLAGTDVAAAIATSGIHPDFIVERP